MSSDATSPLANLEPNSILPLARADLACYALAMCPTTASPTIIAC